MKKRIASLLLLVMLLPAFCVSARAETTLASWNGLELRLLSFSVSDSAEAPYLTLNIRVINDQDTKLWVGFDASSIDGVPVKDTGRTIEPNSDTGSGEPKYYSFMGSGDDGGKSLSAIKNAKTLRTTLIVQDYDSYEELYRTELTVDLTGLNRGQAPAETPRPTAAPSSSGTGSGGTAPAYTPASYDFTTLKKGSKGQAVKDLQQRLTDLGYLNDKVDGRFGQNTATAVMSFCAQHGLYISGEATPEMQSLLYSSSAEYYVEPWIPLIIGPYYKWDDPRQVELDHGRFYPQVVNRSATRTVRGYELYWYITDVWGARYRDTNSGEEVLRRTTMQQTVKPGYIQYTPPVTILPWSWTYTVWVGIHRVVFSDGEIRETDPDDIVYFECPIKK
ncbi:MAG: peptidoglycan-binding protein [Clostridia bacterium]|nr:peptidoglycan-binding protein [Clostridia bacterium]